jgi:leucyl/phenylalanyl-tRNA---protein transferase
MPRLRLDPEAADAQGMVAVGGNLRPETLLDAYRRGIFPWYDESLPVCWWSPDPRGIIPLNAFHISHRLARTIRAGRFNVTVNRDFAAVIRGCSVRAEGTWITPAMIEAYQRLHQMGHAHSVEAWLDGALAGGVYGIALGGFFSAESMYHQQSDASSVALAALVDRLRSQGFALLDVQMVTEHTTKLGAVEIPRHEYLRRLYDAVGMDVTFRET